MGKHRMLFLLLVLLICCLNDGMQAQGILDSLERTWVEITDDSLRVAKQKDGVVFLYREYEDEAGITLALKTLEGAQTLGLEEIEKTTLVLLVMFSQNLDELENFNKYWERAYELSVAQHDTTYIFDLLNVKGSQLVNELKYDSTVIVYHQALELVRANGDVYRQHSLQNNLAIVFAEQGLLVKAKDSFKEAAEASLLLGDSILTFTAYLNVARCFIESEQLDSAAIYMELGDNLKPARLLAGDIAAYTAMAGRLAMAQGDYPAALAYFEEAFTQSETNADKVVQLSKIGEVQFELKHYNAAITTLTEVERMSYQSEDNLTLRDILPVLAQSYAALGDYSHAYDYGQRSIALRDEFLDEEVQRQVVEMQARFELKELTADKNVLEALAVTQQEKVEERTLFAFIAILLLLFIAGLAFMVWKRNKRIHGFNQELGEEVKARTSDLESANQELERYLEDMKMFTHVTSHDLKEPLRNISGFSSLLERRMKGEAQEEDTATFLQMIRSNANQMHRLVESIQLYTKVDNELEEEKLLEEISLSDVITNVKNTLNSSIQEKEAQIHYSDDLPTIYSSASVLQVVLKNLIENGIKYNRSSPPIVKVNYEQKENFHCISITDNGIGIEEDFRAQVFEMFKRLHTQQEFKGTGMGLAISRKLAQRFGGDILLQNQVGEGSVFVLKLPLR